MIAVGAPPRFSITPHDAVRAAQNVIGSKAGAVFTNAAGRNGAAHPATRNVAQKHKTRFMSDSLHRSRKFTNESKLKVQSDSICTFEWSQRDTGETFRSWHYFMELGGHSFANGD
jgi:hypothetical protein